VDSKKPKREFWMKLLSIVLATMFLAQIGLAGTLTVYTDRPAKPLAVIAQDFKARTGHDVVFVEAATADLLKRIELEQNFATTDLLITKDLVFLNQAASAGFFQAFSTAPVAPRVGSFMQDGQQGWTALTFRARTMVYNPDMIDASMLSTYEDLTSDKWAGGLCLRTSKGSYNEALLSFLIAKHGETKAKEIVSGWVKNLAQPPFKNDTAIIEAVSRGECLVGVINSYYLGLAKTSNPTLRAEIFFADQNSGGVHTNGSGVGLLKTSRQNATAELFIDFLLADNHQQALADSHFEYPAALTAVPGTLIRNFGPFKKSELTWTEIGTFVPTARRLMIETGYN
jgi:iron(III) transport system substrate-binding protein